MYNIHKKDSLISEYMFKPVRLGVESLTVMAHSDIMMCINNEVSMD